MDRLKTVLQGHHKSDKPGRTQSDVPHSPSASEGHVQRSNTDPVEHRSSIDSDDHEHNENAAKKRLERQHEREEKAAKMREEIHQRHIRAWEADELKANYGAIDPSDVGENKMDLDVVRERFEAISQKSLGSQVAVRARVHFVRPLSSKVAFIVLRQQLSTLQTVLVAREGKVSTSMINWAERLRPETVVVVQGVLQKPQAAKDKEVKSATFHNIEILVEKVRSPILSQASLTPGTDPRHRQRHYLPSVPRLRCRTTKGRPCLARRDAHVEAVFRPREPGRQSERHHQ